MVKIVTMICVIGAMLIAGCERQPVEQNAASNFQALMERGLVAKYKHDYEKALSYFEAALTADHQWDVELFFHAAQVYEKLERYADAATLLETYLAKFPDNADINQYMAGLLCYKRGLYEEALPYAQKAYAVNDQNIDLLLILGEIYYHLKRYDEGLQFLMRASEINPKSVKVHSALAHVHEQQGNYEKAVEIWTQVLLLKVDDISLYHHIANLNWKLKRREECVRLYEEALAIDPNNITSLNKLAGVYYNLGQLDKSAELYKKALSIDPDNLPALAAMDSINNG